MSLDTTTCEIQQTTDEQLNQNLANMVRLLVTALQDGTIPVANSERLQNLTIDDIIGIVKGSIDIPNLYNHVITNEDNTITNVIDAITAHQITRDSKYVTSDYLQFKVESRPNPNNLKYGDEEYIPYIVVNLPTDLINKDRILAIYLTNKNDASLNLLDNCVLFEYNIFMDPNSIQGGYIVEIPAPQLELGALINYNLSNLPNNPSKWGDYSLEKYIKVTYLVDETWVPSDTVTITAEGDYNVAKSILTNQPISMNYGVNVNNIIPENVNVIPSLERIVINPESTVVDMDKSINVLNSTRWIILQPDNIIPTSNENKVINFLKSNNDKIIIQQDTPEIKNMIDDINEFFTIHSHLDKSVSELSNVFIMPPNKIISQDLSSLESIIEDRKSNNIKTSYSIIENMVSDLLEIKFSQELAGNHAGATTSNYLIAKMALDQNSNLYFKKYYFTDRIIEEIVHEILDWNIQSKYIQNEIAIIEQENLLRFTLNMVKCIKNVNNIINCLGAIKTSFKQYSTILTDSIRVAENKKTIQIGLSHNQKELYLTNVAMGKKLAINTLKYSSNIVEQIDKLIENIKTYSNYFKKATNVSEINARNVIDAGQLTFTNFDSKRQKVKLLAYENLIIPERINIIQPQAYYPITMTVSSATISYIQDLSNLKMVTSLAKREEFIPLYLGEGKQQRSTYELIMEQDQRVINLNTNPYDTTVYREGFRLSRGDYYVDGTKIILKSPANVGETLTIVSERKYTYSNNVSKEELENAINSLKAERPILSYPASTYELATVKIKIENFNSSNIYDISVKIDGSYQTESVFVRHKDTIYVDIPEIVMSKRKTIQVIVYGQEVNKLQSLPTIAEITVKNLYDYNPTDNTSEIKRLVVGVTPAEWYGKQIEYITITEQLTNNSTYTFIDNDEIGPDRVKLEQNNYIQSTVINKPSFNGSFIDPFIGLENMNSRRIPILSTSTSETILDIGMSADPTKFTQTYIENAFANGNLWFIIDASTDNAINNEFLNAVNGGVLGSNQKYAYRRANELMNSINMLPRTDTTIYLEHIDKLKNRLIKDVIIFDVDFKIDYDFENFAEISETGQVAKLNLGMESIEYKVQENIPFMLIKITNPKIPNPNNPYLNLSSKIVIPMKDELLQKQTELDNNGFTINNMYNERIFSGLMVDHSHTGQEQVLPKLMNYKKFNLDYNYNLPFNLDHFILTEEDTGLTDTTGLTDKKEVHLGLVRFKLDDQVIKEDIYPQTRLKLFNKFLTREKSIKSLVKIDTATFSSDASYQTDFAIFEYGGYATYIDSKNIEHKVIDSVISYRKVFIKDNFEIENGIIKPPASTTDGYTSFYDTYKEIKIPNYWDVVYNSNLRGLKDDELRFIWELIRDDVDISDQRWLNITDGLLEKGVYQKNTANFIGGNLLKDSEVINNENGKGFFIFGGMGYTPIKTRRSSVRVNGNFLSALYYAEDPILPLVTWAYNTRYEQRYESRTRTNPDGSTETYSHDTNQWFNRTDILDVRYGWANDEPYVEYHWAQSFTVRTNDNGSYQALNYYVDRVSRVKTFNKDIYYVDTSLIDNGYNLDHSQYSQDSAIIRKISITDYKDLYKMRDGTYFDDINDTNRVVFQDIVYESGCWWLTIKPADSKNTILCKFIPSGLPESTNTSYDFVKVKTLDVIESRWSLVKDITTTLRGEGPILIKHLSNTDYLANTNTIEGGIYYYDTWNDNLIKKVEINIPASSDIFGISDVDGVRNPYLLLLDGLLDINKRIDIVGTRIFLIVYLDKYMAKLTKDEFNLFKEEIFNIHNGLSYINPDKDLLILQNDQSAVIKTILPDGDDYRSTGAQVLFMRQNTQTGRRATNLVFRVTNTIDIPLEIDSVRFVTK